LENLSTSAVKSYEEEEEGGGEEEQEQEGKDELR
jgi:hypothetical protein